MASSGGKKIRTEVRRKKRGWNCENSLMKLEAGMKKEEMS
jgi:hypothetical protein